MTKYHISIISGILLLILGIYIYKDANIIIESSKGSPYVEQKNIETIGYENGKKIFSVKTKKIQQKTYQHIFFAYEILNGTVFNKRGEKIIDEIKGNYGRINTSFKSIFVTNNITAIIHPSSSTKSIDVMANEFRYNHQEKRAHFSKLAKLNVNDIEINTSNFDYYNKYEILFFEDGLSLNTSDSITSVNRAVIDINLSTIRASQNVQTRYKKEISQTDSQQLKNLLKSPTIIEADEINIDFSTNKKSIVTYRKNVKVSQKNKYMISDKVNLNFKTSLFQAEKDIFFNFESLKWLLNENRLIKNKNIRSMLGKETQIKAQKAVFNSKTNQLVLKNKIELKQQNFKLNCDLLEYDINNEKITLKGNVVIKKFGIEHFNSNKLIIDIKNETFRSDSTQNLSEIMLEI